MLSRIISPTDVTAFVVENKRPRLKTLLDFDIHKWPYAGFGKWLFELAPSAMDNQWFESGRDSTTAADDRLPYRSAMALHASQTDIQD